MSCSFLTSYVICFLLVSKNPSRRPSDISDVTHKIFFISNLNRPLLHVNFAVYFVTSGRRPDSNEAPSRLVVDDVLGCCLCPRQLTVGPKHKFLPQWREPYVRWVLSLSPPTQLPRRFLSSLTSCFQRGEKERDFPHLESRTVFSSFKMSSFTTPPGLV